MEHVALRRLIKGDLHGWPWVISEGNGGQRHAPASQLALPRVLTEIAPSLLAGSGVTSSRATRGRLARLLSRAHRTRRCSVMQCACLGGSLPGHAALSRVRDDQVRPSPRDEGLPADARSR